MCDQLTGNHLFSELYILDDQIVIGESDGGQISSPHPTVETEKNDGIEVSSPHYTVKTEKSDGGQVNSPHPMVKTEKNNGGQFSSPRPKVSTEKSDGCQVSSPHPTPTVKTEKKEDNMSSKESSTTERTEKVAKDRNENGKGSHSHKPDKKSSISRSSSSENKSPGKKKLVVIEPAPVDLLQPVDSSPQNGTHKVDSLAIKTPPKVDRVVTETPLAQTLPNENNSNNNQSSKDNEDSLTSENLLLSDSKDAKCPYCGKGGDDRVNDLPKTPKCSKNETQPLLDLAPRAAKKSSWKSCCGIFELTGILLQTDAITYTVTGFLVFLAKHWLLWAHKKLWSFLAHIYKVEVTSLTFAPSTNPTAMVLVFPFVEYVCMVKVHPNSVPSGNRIVVPLTSGQLLLDTLGTDVQKRCIACTVYVDRRNSDISQSGSVPKVH
ncbi:hypothetical protein Tco_0003158 [Tanacetum coccineum]